MPEGEKDQEHIGDGVYVSHDGCHLLLRANHHESPDVIALDPLVLQALKNYEKRMREKYSEKEPS